MRAFDTILMFTIGSILWQIPRSGSERERLVRLASLGPAEALNVIALGDEYARATPTTISSTASRSRSMVWKHVCGQ